MKTLKISEKDFSILKKLVRQHHEFFDGKIWTIDDTNELIHLGNKITSIISNYTSKEKKIIPKLLIKFKRNATIYRNVKS
ncbi:MAG: hypothetical protein V1781_04150 [Bacteroidota bacterium]